jgi:glycerol-3-phosphate acyltransferase PlsY
MALPHYVAALAIGYLFGSIPFGLLITRLAGTTDVRKVGSGNIGATNVLRTGRWELAAATLVADLLKGTAAVVLIDTLWGRDHALIAGLGAFFGHLFPIWLRFMGGKGVATYLGLLLGLLAWPGALGFVAAWIAVAALTRYSSLAALAASAAAPALLWATGDRQEAVLFGLLTVMVFVRHRTNIARLLAGTEAKLGLRSMRGS